MHCNIVLLSQYFYILGTLDIWMMIIENLFTKILCVHRPSERGTGMYENIQKSTPHAPKSIFYVTPRHAPFLQTVCYTWTNDDV